MKHMKLLCTGLCCFLLALMPVPIQASGMETSLQGVEFIKSFEGLRLTAYKPDQDEAFYTIGYGHHASDVSENMTITEEEATRLLVEDISAHEYWLNLFLDEYDIQVTQSQYDALSSFTFNLGCVWQNPQYPDFTLKEMLINGIQYYSTEDITKAFLEWNKGASGKELPGLTWRRLQEAALFLQDGLQDACTCDVYRVYNPNTKEHIYTSSKKEVQNLVQLGWEDEGACWEAPLYSSIPVYRLYDPAAGDHRYTIDAGEADTLIAEGWLDEGIAWYASESETGIPVYRMFDPEAVSGAHYYTTEYAETIALRNKGWQDEGIGWYQ